MTQSLYHYLNCYGILEEVRTELNEYSDTLCQGTTKGSFDNSDIVRKINASQRFIWNMLFTRFPELFLTSQSVSGVAGVYTIPSDCYQINFLDPGDGNRIGKIPVKGKHLPNRTGSPYLYYRYGNTIVRDDGSSGAVTFYYYSRPRDLTQGMSSAGGALALTLATTARKEADYYKGVTIEDITDDWVDTITAYATTRVATLAAQTGAANKYYGTVSELPEPFHALIAPRAVILMKNSVVSPQKATQQEITDFTANLVETIRSFTGTYSDDVGMDEIFYDFAPFM